MRGTLINLWLQPQLTFYEDECQRAHGTVAATMKLCDPSKSSTNPQLTYHEDECQRANSTAQQRIRDMDGRNPNKNCQLTAS